MKKEDILLLITETLASDLAVLHAAATTAHEAAIHEENRPDNKYDTLSLEASYVAQGQANRAQEIKGALATYRGLTLHRFSDATPIRLTALVTLLAEDGTEKRVFIGPAAGGLQVTADGRGIVVITPQSPLGRELLGKSTGDSVMVGNGTAQKEFEIVEVS
jgi:transcription elongation GreA/GreB family factor